MTSPIRNTYAQGQWHEITPGTLWTQFTHNSGGSVVYTEASAEPLAYDETVPINAKSKQNDNVYFQDVTAGDSIFFWPLSSEVSMTITVMEV